MQASTRQHKQAAGYQRQHNHPSQNRCQIADIETNPCVRHGMITVTSVSLIQKVKQGQHHQRSCYTKNQENSKIVCIIHCLNGWIKIIFLQRQCCTNRRKHRTQCQNQHAEESDQPQLFHALFPKSNMKPFFRLCHFPSSLGNVKRIAKRFHLIGENFFQ